MSKNQTYLILGGGCLLALCAVAALLGGIFFFTPLFGSQILAPGSDIVNIESKPRPQAANNSMGDPEAPIQIVEFGDFQCPYCERFATETEPFLVENYIETGDLYFTYRSAGNWVSQNIGDGKTESQDAAQSAYCAADQNKFWEMHDSLFANNRDVEDQGSFSSARLLAIAESIGLNMGTFQDCYDTGKYADQVQQDYEDAIAAGVQGTPTFVVTYAANGETKSFLIEGAQPYAVFEQMLDQVLQEIGE